METYTMPRYIQIIKLIYENIILRRENFLKSYARPKKT